MIPTPLTTYKAMGGGGEKEGVKAKGEEEIEKVRDPIKSVEGKELCGGEGARVGKYGVQVEGEGRDHHCQLQV